MTTILKNSETLLEELYPAYSKQPAQIVTSHYIYEDALTKTLKIGPAGYSKPIQPYPPYTKFDLELRAPLTLSRQDTIGALWAYAGRYYSEMKPYPLDELTIGGNFVQHKVHLVPEQNPYDKYAVLMVLELTRTSPTINTLLHQTHLQQLGYVPKAISYKIRHNIDKIKPGRIYRISKSVTNAKTLWSLVVEFPYDIAPPVVYKTLGRFKRVIA